MPTGAVQARTALSRSYFGEGMSRFGDRLYQILWRTNLGFVYSIPDLQQVRYCSSSSNTCAVQAQAGICQSFPETLPHVTGMARFQPAGIFEPSPGRSEGVL